MPLRIFNNTASINSQRLLDINNNHLSNALHSIFFTIQVSTVIVVPIKGIHETNYNPFHTE